MCNSCFYGRARGLALPSAMLTTSPCVTQTDVMASCSIHKPSKSSRILDSVTREEFGIRTEWPYVTQEMHKEAHDEESKKSSSCISGCDMFFLEQACSPLEEGLPAELPSIEKLACILDRCSSLRGSELVLRLYDYMCRFGLEAHPLIGNQLVPMLMEAGNIADAQQLFDRLAHPKQRCWNSLITGLIRSGAPQQALRVYQKMQEDDSVHPCRHTFLALLKACGKLNNLEQGCTIHAHVARQGLLHNDSYIGSSLVSMYTKCGSFPKAEEVFNKLRVQDVVSWTALIAGYAESGRAEEALKCYEQMQLQGISPNVVTFVCCLKACTIARRIDKGEDLHAKLSREGLEKDLVVGTTLVDMYAKCGLLAKAQGVFDSLPIRNLVSWNALIGGYTQHGEGEKALFYFQQMQLAGISPDDVTFVCCLKACASLKAIDQGQELHAKLSEKGLERDLVVGTSLVDMYAKCGSLAKAQEIFDGLPNPSLVSWTALISGYTEHGYGEEAWRCYQRMQLAGIPPNTVTFACALKACAILKATSAGQKVHAEVSGKGLEGDVVVGTALVDMYAKFGWLAKAQEVFDRLPIRNVVTWTSLVAGYAEHQFGEEALKCYEGMRLDGVAPNTVSYVCSLKVCASLGCIDKGQEIHAEISKTGLEKDLGNPLIEMYAKCGLLAKAREVFYNLPTRNVVSWSALIAGYAQLGEIEIVFFLFDKMMEGGIKPSLVTFISVLTACSHTGQVEKGQGYFEAMSKDHGINPVLEHYTCVLNLLARAGQLENAVALIKKFPFCADHVVWQTLLSACLNWRDAHLGRQAFKHALQLDDKDSGVYVSMSNFYLNF